MIYKFRMISGGEVAFLRDYEIEARSNFLNFHAFIQKNLNYDTHQLASFFLADEQWNKGMELTLMDMQNDSGFAAIPMETVTIGDILKNKKERLLYVFDIFSDRALFIELIDISKPNPKIVYPCCSASIGEAPEQIQLDLNVDDMDLGDEIDEDIDEVFGDDLGDEGIDYNTEFGTNENEDY